VSCAVSRNNARQLVVFLGLDFNVYRCVVRTCRYNLSQSLDLARDMALRPHSMSKGICHGHTHSQVGPAVLLVQRRRTHFHLGQLC
jgi:hypothetical protein